MKRIKLLVIFLFLATAITFAQQKKYVSYSVKKGETIKSIAKEYNMSTRDLLRLNPGVGRKPKPNTVIIVPNKNYGKVVTEVKTTVEKGVHVVQPKETVFGISKKYGITIADLESANPQIKNGLKTGMKLKIPESVKVEDEALENYLLHTVVKDDTVYNLTKRYNVSVTELYKLNPALIDGLKLGMVLKIKPTDTAVTDEEVEVDEEAVEDKIFTEYFNLNKEIKVVFMLPYQLNKLSDSIGESNFKKTNSLLNIVTDFHLGAEIAIDSLKQRGVRVSTSFYDTQNSDSKLRSLVNSIDFNEVDVVIGPLFFDNAHWVSKNISAPVVAPLFSKKQKSLSGGNLVKSAPKSELLEERLFNYLKENYNGENFVVINDGKTESQSKLWQVVNKLKSFDSIQEISVIKPEKGYIANEKIAQKLKEDANNWVLLVSDDNLTTASAVNNLKVLDEEFKITLFALDKGKNFDKLDNNFLGELNLVFPTTEFLNTEDANVKRFYKKYQAKNNTFPSKYAIRGFDVTYDILARIATFENLDDGLKAGKSARVSSGFNYHKKLFGSFENTEVFLIQYSKDLTTKILE